jgi:uncharacterized membrane protein
MALEYLHPMLVHFPIALTLAGTGILAWGTLRAHGGAVRSALVVLCLAGALSIPTYITGQVARSVLEDAGAFDRDSALVDHHEDLGLYSMAVLVSLGLLAGLSFRKGATIPERPWFLLALALAASVFIVVTAWQGGRLVFDQGIGVRSHAPPTTLSK